MVNGHAPISHKVKHQDELRGITAKLIKIEKLEVREICQSRAELNRRPVGRVVACVRSSLGRAAR